MLNSLKLQSRRQANGTVAAAGRTGRMQGLLFVSVGMQHCTQTYATHASIGWVAGKLGKPIHLS